MPITVSLKEAYPEADGLSPDAYSVRIISPAYASAQGELNAVLQYTYQSFFFEKNGYAQIAETLKGIAACEMRHLSLLGKTILALGAAPVYSQYPGAAFNFYSAKYVTYSHTLRHMLEDDILGERRTVAAYAKMIKCLKNEQVAAIIARILEDEKLHLARLTEILCSFTG